MDSQVVRCGQRQIFQPRSVPSKAQSPELSNKSLSGALPSGLCLRKRAQWGQQRRTAGASHADSWRAHRSKGAVGEGNLFATLSDQSASRRKNGAKIARRALTGKAAKKDAGAVLEDVKEEAKGRTPASACRASNIVRCPQQSFASTIFWETLWEPRKSILETSFCVDEPPDWLGCCLHSGLLQISVQASAWKERM